MADDASSKVPYLQAHGNLKKALERLIKASVPTRFTQDFLATKLDLPGGGARPVIPYLKRAGLLTSDGAPTELYKQFRNPTSQGAAAAQALRNAYPELFASNEYVYDTNDEELKGLIIQVTGLDDGSRLIPVMISSFKTLRAYADFDAGLSTEGSTSSDGAATPATLGTDGGHSLGRHGLNLGYTINLNLPATTDIAVFNAIFKSLRENLLQ